MKFSALSRAILASLLLHGLLLLTLCLRLHFWALPTPASESLLVDLLESPTAKPTPAPSAAALPPINAQKQTQNTLAQVAPSWKPLPPLQASEPRAQGEENSISDWALGPSDSALRGKHLSAISWVYRKTKQSLSYPTAFRNHDIQGEVEARFSFDHQGKLIKNSLLVKSNSPYLRIYVYRLVERIFLEEPIPRELRKWENLLDIICSIRFRFVENQAAIDMLVPVPIAGNRLYFAQTNLRSKLQWELGPFSGMYLVPMIGMNPLWFVDQTKKIFEDKAPVDELAFYRNDPLFYD